MSDHGDILVGQDLVHMEVRRLDENHTGTCLDEGDDVWALLDASPDGSVIRVNLDDLVFGKDRDDRMGHGDGVESGVDCGEVESGVDCGEVDW